MVLSKKPLTLAEFLRLPEAEPALEYFRGRVSQKVSPKIRHGAIQYGLGLDIGTYAVPRRLARVFSETRATFAGSSTVPDLIVVRWDRVPYDEAGELAEDFDLAPDIAVEILSPGQGMTTLAERCQWSVDNGVEVALLIRPNNRTIRVFRPGQPPRVLRDDDLIDFGEVLPGFEPRVRDVFAYLRSG